ncbi:MAG TPA: zinc-dependent metalloprotease, partial [Tetrasphaera sp.]|uniref:zinc-dependent metalloprotease n=1 Tax=Nostocoides sp. TaxID=1917966 RepID=UPI002B678E64
GGPAEKTFASLVGLQLRPRRLRDAANLFAALEAAGGVAMRDGAWAHPDLAPSGADLDDVLGYVERRQTASGGDDVDAALEALLRGETT